MASFCGAPGVLMLMLQAALALLAAGPVAGASPAPHPATYFNDGSTPGADPFVRFDRRSGYYFAYSTDGADAGFHFAIYRSPDLATWQRLPGGALPAADPKQWAHDWFWAPEVYHNEKTGVYFLFYSGRMNTQVARHFQHADFEEPCKVGVAVAPSPQGPFRNITAAPLDYFPYDPAYHDVNLIMDARQKLPPATRAEGMRAPRGTYLPFIDPNVFFDDTGRIILYFSRNAYRNWVWDDALGKYIEESNIYAVELDTAWWHDPHGATMPRIAASYRNANRPPDDPADVRKDGFTPILAYGSAPQAWENAHVDDYAKTGGRKKNRRWAEGSTTLKVQPPAGPPVYFLTYSANNYENEHYGVGYAVADSPLGPWRKSPANPLLAANPAQSLLSTGHGSVTESPDGRQRFYVHHGRRSTRDNRRLYTQRLQIDPEPPPALSIAASTTDEPMPSGVAPLGIRASDHALRARPGAPVTTTVVVTSATGAGFDLTHPLNRLRAEFVPASPGAVTVSGPRVTVTLPGSTPTRLRVFYQRQRADRSYVDTLNPDGTPVEIEIPIGFQP
jgi:hypothetical protein